MVRQLSVFVENTTGSLAEVCGCLVASGIDMRFMAVADTTDFGILRLIVDAPEDAGKALKAAGYTVRINEVIAIEVSDTPGGLLGALTLLSSAGCTVEYLYAFVGKRGAAYGVIKTDDNEKAARLLGEKGIRTADEVEIKG